MGLLTPPILPAPEWGLCPAVDWYRLNALMQPLSWMCTYVYSVHIMSTTLFKKNLELIYVSSYWSLQLTVFLLCMLLNKKILSFIVWWAPHLECAFICSNNSNYSVLLKMVNLLLYTYQLTLLLLRSLVKIEPVTSPKYRAFHNYNLCKSLTIKSAHSDRKTLKTYIINLVKSQPIGGI